MRFRKKPVVIDAIQFTGAGSYQDMLAQWGEPFARVAAHDPGGNQLNLRTLESYHAPLTASAGDWVIRGIQGEFYPCKPDIFAQTYEPAES